MKAMMKKMMVMMEGMQKDVKEVKQEVGSATEVACQAKAAADSAKSIANDVRKEMNELKEVTVTKDDLNVVVREAVAERIKDLEADAGGKCKGTADAENQRDAFGDAAESVLQGRRVQRFIVCGIVDARSRSTLH